ncbi:uncharacterized protein V6R79_024108 [Siganus canaliculatus]
MGLMGNGGGSESWGLDVTAEGRTDTKTNAPFCSDSNLPRSENALRFPHDDGSGPRFPVYGSTRFPVPGSMRFQEVPCSRFHRNITEPHGTTQNIKEKADSRR